MTYKTKPPGVLTSQLPSAIARAIAQITPAEGAQIMAEQDTALKAGKMPPLWEPGKKAG